MDVCVVVYIKYKPLKKFHFPLNTDKFKLLRWSISKNYHDLYSFNNAIAESVNIKVIYL